jgi:hypothetical protein
MLDVLSENMAEGLVMAVLKENNIDVASFEIKQSWTQRLVAWLHRNLVKFEYH